MEGGAVQGGDDGYCSRGGGLEYMKRTIRITLLSIAYALICFSVRAQVTPQRLVDSSKEPQNWLTYSGDYAGHRFSALDQINVKNGHSLVAKWVYQTGAPGDGSH